MQPKASPPCGPAPSDDAFLLAKKRKVEKAAFHMQKLAMNINARFPGASNVRKWPPRSDAVGALTTCLGSKAALVAPVDTQANCGLFGSGLAPRDEVRRLHHCCLHEGHRPRTTLGSRIFTASPFSRRSLDPISRTSSPRALRRAAVRLGCSRSYRHIPAGRTWRSSPGSPSVPCRSSPHG